MLIGLENKEKINLNVLFWKSLFISKLYFSKFYHDEFHDRFGIPKQAATITAATTIHADCDQTVAGSIWLASFLSLVSICLFQLFP